MAIITVSRGTFSGGQILAENIAARLGYRCISRELLVETARQYGISEEKLSAAISEAPGVWERLRSEKQRYLTCLRATLIREVKDENVVYHGHAGHLLLTGVPNIIRVRVIANIERRIKALTERSNLSREKALLFIKRVDDERIRWTRFLYHVDWSDPALYDMVLNLDHITDSDACDIVCHTAGMNQYLATEHSRKLLDDLLLSSHLEALISNTTSISGGKEVEIKADGGVVTIEGTVGSVVDADKVRVLACKTPGVTEINSRMKVRLYGVSTSGTDYE
jgi:cytidylate kinase